jgi:hypothetical protein
MSLEHVAILSPFLVPQGMFDYVLMRGRIEKLVKIPEQINLEIAV